MLTILRILPVMLLAVASMTSQQSRALNEDFSGLYTFVADGESVQLTLQPPPDPTTDWTKPMRLDGYVSRLDDGAIVDHFFKSGSFENGKIKFVSKPLHGVWYEFNGHVQRGEARSRDLEGYFIIRGKLTEHRVDKKGKEKARTRELEMRSFASLDEAPEMSPR